MHWLPQFSFISSLSALIQAPLQLQSPLSHSPDMPTLPSTQKFTPREQPFDVDSYPLAPDGLVLEQVHVYVRHGQYFYFSPITTG